MISSPAIDRLVASLKRLPGIGEKSATRLAFFLLGAPDKLLAELGDAVALIHIRLRVEDLVAVDAPCQAVVVGAREGETTRQRRGKVPSPPGWGLG